MSRFGGRRVLLCAVAAGVLFGGCGEPPTSPATVSHRLAGKLWTAVSVPAGTPDWRTWLPYMRETETSSESAEQQVRRLRADAERLLRAGDVSGWEMAREAAMHLAAESIGAMPPPPVLIAAIAALDTWAERVAGLSSRPPALEVAFVEVGALRRSAADALQQADTLAAVRHLSRAADHVHRHSPAAVAAAALVTAEARIAERALADADAHRALRLLRNARFALAEGDERKALRRAFYALQLAEQSTPK